MNLRLTAMIALAHVRLRQDIIDRYPHLRKRASMDPKKPPLSIPRPVELFGMRARLLRAQMQKTNIAATGKAYDEVMDGIDDAHQAIKGHVGDLKMVEYSLRSTIESMIDRSNGGPTDGESDGRQSSSDHGEQGDGADVRTDDVKTKAAADSEGEPGIVAAAAAAASPEPLTVNGVSVQS